VNDALVVCGSELRLLGGLTFCSGLVSTLKYCLNNRSLQTQIRHADTTQIINVSTTPFLSTKLAVIPRLPHTQTNGLLSEMDQTSSSRLTPPRPEEVVLSTTRRGSESMQQPLHSVGFGAAQRSNFVSTVLKLPVRPATNHSSQAYTPVCQSIYF
jgi:hypothetical protein